MESGSKNLVYGLIDPRDGKVRYIGKSTKGLLRPQSHSAYTKRGGTTHRANWIRQLHRLGMEYDIVVLEKCLLPEQLAEAEVRWVKHFRERGAKLTNMSDGGEGLLGYKHKPEAIAKMSKAKKGKPLPYEITPEMRERRAANLRGRKASLETRAKLSESHMGHRQTEETKEKIRIASTGRKLSQEACAKISASKIGKKRSPETIEKMRLASSNRSAETRAKMSAASKKRMSSEENRQKLREANLGKKLSPEIRAKISAFQKGRPKSPEHRAKLAAHCRKLALERKLKKQSNESSTEATNGTP